MNERVVPVSLRDNCAVMRLPSSFITLSHRKEGSHDYAAPAAHAEDALDHLAQQFAQWRDSRTTLRGRIPKPLWA
jgi:hypothetical protein